MQQDLRIATGLDYGRYWIGPRILPWTPESFVTRSYWLLEGYRLVPVHEYFPPCSGL